MTIRFVNLTHWFFNEQLSLQFILYAPLHNNEAKWKYFSFYIKKKTEKSRVNLFLNETNKIDYHHIKGKGFQTLTIVIHHTLRIHKQGIYHQSPTIYSLVNEWRNLFYFSAKFLFNPIPGQHRDTNTSEINRK